MHTDTTIHTYICTYIQTGSCTNIHKYTHSLTYIRTYTHSHAYIHTDRLRHAYIQIQTRIHAYKLRNIHTHTHTYIHIYIKIHAHTHTHTHTHTYIYIHILSNAKSADRGNDSIIRIFYLQIHVIQNPKENSIANNHHHHHHVVLVARISLTLSRHFSLSFIASGRSSGQHPVSSHCC